MPYPYHTVRKSWLGSTFFPVLFSERPLMYVLTGGTEFRVDIELKLNHCFVVGLSALDSLMYIFFKNNC